MLLQLYIILHDNVMTTLPESCAVLHFLLDTARVVCYNDSG